MARRGNLLSYNRITSYRFNALLHIQQVIFSISIIKLLYFTLQIYTKYIERVDFI